MKKACSILLLFVFSFNLVGVAIIFKVQQFQIRREIKRQIMRGIPDEELCVISVNQANDAELFWLGDDEFFYHGSIYDVVRKVTLSETEATYYCINDTLEENLFANLDTLVKRQKTSREPWGGLVKKLYQLLAGLFFKSQETISFLHKSPSKIGWYFSVTYRSVFLSIASPPPQALAC